MTYTGGMIYIATLLFFCLCPLLSFSETPQEKGLAIVRQVEVQNSGWEDEVMSLSMDITDSDGQKDSLYIRWRVLEGDKEGELALAIVRMPTELKGSIILSQTNVSQGDSYWLYDKKTKKLDKVSSNNISASFLGSDFAYEDLTSQEIGKYTHTFLREDVLDGRRCAVIEKVPSYHYSAYSKLDVWIDILHYIPVRIDYYALDGELLKTLSFSKYEKYRHTFWRSKIQLMEHKKSGRKTQVQWGNRSFANQVSADQFLPQHLNRLR
jgi:outer membrane lipoprotein-sorting protein